ncbi:NAD(P)-dependent oxidoreductase [Rhodopila sp.]|uniref:NAD(P)-dependent oxidoreductase n=1 Tax=Rhodopila sp. TaxID=2480087 RepID=UPI003D132D40
MIDLRRESDNTMRIGFVGIGTMGSPIAECLIRAGHSLSVYDRRSEATGVVCAQGAVRTDSACLAAHDNEVVFTSLPGPVEFEAAMLEPRTGILAGLRPGAVHIDLTTNAPKTVARIGEACRSRGVELVDAPVSGRPPAMTVMIGASDAAFAKYRPLFDIIAANVFHVGPSGTGATAKLVTQYLGYTNFIASIEGMLVAARAGIDLDILAEIVPVSAGQSRTFDNIALGVFSGSFAAGGTLDIVAKDIELACQLARDVGAPATLGALASDIYKRAQALGWGQEGFPIVARVLEAMAGTELRRRELAPGNAKGGKQ